MISIKTPDRIGCFGWPDIPSLVLLTWTGDSFHLERATEGQLRFTSRKSQRKLKKKKNCWREVTSPWWPHWQWEDRKEGCRVTSVNKTLTELHLIYRSCRVTSVNKNSYRVALDFTTEETHTVFRRGTEQRPRYKWQKLWKCYRKEREME